MFLHNSSLMVAIFWAPNYFFFRTSMHDLEQWTLPSLHTLLRAKELFLVLLADNTELISEGSLNTLLQLYLYSFKLKHKHSLKLFTACLSSGMIVYRAPLFGGSTPEVTALEVFVASAELAALRKQHAFSSVVCATDLGFTETDPELLSKWGVQLLFPTSTIAGRRLNPTEVFLKEVQERPTSTPLTV